MTTTALQTTATGEDAALLERVLADGDIAKLTPAQRVSYYKMRCDAAGLDHRAQPFMFVSLQGKLVLYATRAATQQLAAKHKISTQIVSRTTEDGLHVVVVRASTASSSTDEIGAVSVAGKKGDDLANCYMKAATKAKRRAVLALCGLGEMDETEVETVPRAALVPVNLDTGVIEEAATILEATPVRTETAKPDPRKTTVAAQSATARGGSPRGATGAPTAAAGNKPLTPADVVPTGHVVRAPKPAGMTTSQKKLAKLREFIGPDGLERFDADVKACGDDVVALEGLASNVAKWLEESQ